MIKYTIILFICLINPILSSAQSTFFKEWFQQKSTQREYLLNQIAALQMYSGYLKKGYDIYKKGHKTIGDFKNGEFNLHQDFFLSLKGINPEIARYSRIADIVQLQLKIIHLNRKTLQQLRREGFAPSEEVEYISGVFDKLLDGCAGLVSELVDITTAGKLEMEDNQRIQRIDQLYKEMQENYHFAESFSTDAIYLSQARKKEKTDIEFYKRLLEK